MAELIIDDDVHDLTPFWKPVVDGQPKSRGYDASQWRDYLRGPVEMMLPPAQMQLIPQSEWSDRIKEMEETKSRLSDLRNKGMNGQRIPSLDQNGNGFCWAFSCGSALQLIRARQNAPYVRFNPTGIASVIKNGRNEGGWCGLSAEFNRANGMTLEEDWPGSSRDVRKYWTAECKEKASRFKVTEDWVDLSRAVYDQNLTFAQVATCLLNRVPCQVDFNWWSHSVCAVDLVEVERGSFGIRIWNSWGDSWSEAGMGILRGDKAICDGAVAPRVLAA